MPAAARIRPIGVKVKKLKGASPSARSRSLTMILGGVPIRVVAPPRRLPKARGMSSREGEMLALRARKIMAGSRTATVPVSLMKLERRATAAMITTIRRNSPPPAMARMRRPIMPASPV